MPKWRPFTWVIVVINVLFLVWIIAGLAGISDSCADRVGQDREACEAGTAVGASIGVGIIVVLCSSWTESWASSGWLLARRAGRVPFAAPASKRA
jgi:hypothetical protein